MVVMPTTNAYFGSQSHNSLLFMLLLDRRPYMEGQSKIKNQKSKILDYPLQFEPILVDRLWGGQRLATVLGKRLPPNKRIGESWEISDQGDLCTTVLNGPLHGRTLREIM